MKALLIALQFHHKAARWPGGRRPVASSNGRSSLGFGLFTLAMLSAFVGLGVWQLQRGVEKHALIAALTERLAVEPLRCRLHRHGAHLRRRKMSSAASVSKRRLVRDRMPWFTAPARRFVTIFPDPAPGPSCRRGFSSGEIIAVNAGFVQNMMQDRAEQDRDARSPRHRRGIDLTGYIRFPERAGWQTPAANIAKRLWFARDHQDMARALGWGEVAPFYIDLEQPAPLSGIPKPGPLQVHLKDDHLQYAVIRFSLAVAVTIAFFVWWRGQAHPRTA